MKKGTVVYITIPEHKRKNFLGFDSFHFDPAIPLPLEIPHGDAMQNDAAEPPGAFSSKEIRPAMILSGLFLELEQNPEGKHSAYYRNLLALLVQAITAEKSCLDAVNLIEQGNEEKGIYKAKEFLEKSPRSGKGWFVLGWGLRRLSRWNESAECFKKAMELGLLNADIRNELAICYIETGDLEAASAELEKALLLEPDSVKIISNLGVLAVKQGNDKKAAAFFRSVLEHDPDDAVALAFFRD